MATSTSDLSQQMAARLREARIRKYPSAAAAARALGINEVTLRAHESGQNGIPADLMVTYCRGYDVDLNWLVRGYRPTDLHLDKLKGMELEVAGTLQVGAYLDPSNAPEDLSPLEVPNVSPLFGIEVYLVGSDVWPEFPKGSYLICTPAAAIAIRAGDLIVAERTRGGLKELTLRRLDYSDEGELALHDVGPNGGAPVPLTGKAMSNEYALRAVAHQHVRSLLRPGVGRNINDTLPIVQIVQEPL